MLLLRRRSSSAYFSERPLTHSARIHGEPGSPEFEACYQSLLAASTAAEVERIRDRTTKKKQRERHDYFGADAIMAWAKKQPLTLEQAQHVRRALGIPIDELLQRE